MSVRVRMNNGYEYTLTDEPTRIVDNWSGSIEERGLLGTLTWIKTYEGASFPAIPVETQDGPIINLSYVSEIWND